MCKCVSILYISTEKYLTSACPCRDLYNNFSFVKQYLTSSRVNVFNKLIFILRHAQWIFAVTKNRRFGLSISMLKAFRFLNSVPLSFKFCLCFNWYWSFQINYFSLQEFSASHLQQKGTNNPYGFDYYCYLRRACVLPEINVPLACNCIRNSFLLVTSSIEHISLSLSLSLSLSQDEALLVHTYFVPSEYIVRMRCMTLDISCVRNSVCFTCYVVD